MRTLEDIRRPILLRPILCFLSVSVVYRERLAGNDYVCLAILPLKSPKSEANRKRNEKSVLSGACGGGVSRTWQLRKQKKGCSASSSGHPFIQLLLRIYNILVCV